MPTKLYVHLRDGSDVVIDNVTATPTLDDKNVQSQPYRDLGHRGPNNSTADLGLDIVVLDGGGDSASSVDGVVFTNTTGLAKGAGNVPPSGKGITQSVPDNVSHVPPRQTALKMTVYVFATSSGIEHWIPFEDVITWSTSPRL